MKYILLLSFLLAIMNSEAQAQQYDQLTELKDHQLKIYYSNKYNARATAMAGRLDKAIEFNFSLLGFKPDVTLLILSPDDWNTFTTFPVYGMPHYNDDKTLIVAAEDNAFWKSFVPPLDKLPETISGQIKKVYSQPDGTLSMEAFFDLLAIHELGHAFHQQGGLTMQRKWLAELFVNILLHTFIAENEPQQLPALTLFPQMVVGGGSTGFKYTSLRDIEERYDEIGQQYPQNYGWYQCRWHVAAELIYNTGRKQLLKKLWDALQNNKELLADNKLVDFLEKSGNKTLADVPRNWDSK